MIRLALLIAGAAACSSAARAPAARIAGGDRKVAAQRGREVIQEAYRVIRGGDLDGLQPLFSPTLFALGPRPGDVFVSRTDAVVALADGASGGKRHRVTSRSLVVVGSPGGRSAWAADQLTIDGVPYRMSAVLAEADELWFIAALHLARTLPDDKLAKLQRDGKLAAPAGLAESVEPAADEVAALFLAGARAPDQFTGQLADSPDAVVYDSGPRDGARGARAIRRMWKKAQARHPKIDPADAVRASLTPDGNLAWVAATGQVSADGVAPSVRRYLAVYERTRGGWRLVALHGSVAH